MVTSRQQAKSSIRRDAWVEVDLSAIENNVQIIRNRLGLESVDRLADNRAIPELMAVVKSDAYGHGAVPVSEVLLASGVSWLAVASVDEGCQLRSANADVPILILSPSPFWAINTAIENGLDLTVTSKSEISTIQDVANKMQKKVRLHLKIDTGMHRLGCQPSEAQSLVEEILNASQLELISVYSHLAQADDEHMTFSQDQLFRQVLKRLNSEVVTNVEDKSSPGRQKFFTHLASSDAAQLFEFSHHDLVRVGLHIYGLESSQVSDTFTPALSVRGRINHISDIPKGAAVGYGLTWTAKRPTRLATIPIGYADGIDRGLSNRIFGLSRGQLISQVGMISMDQMLFDITDLTEAQEGDIITLVGRDGGKVLHLADWAKLLETITYELACRLRVRLPRIYTRQKQSQIRI